MASGQVLDVCVRRPVLTGERPSQVVLAGAADSPEGTALSWRPRIRSSPTGFSRLPAEW